MSIATEQLLKQILSLPADERVRLAEQLLESLEGPDERNREIWGVEAERRLDAYERGELKAVPAEDVITELRNKFRKQG